MNMLAVFVDGLRVESCDWGGSCTVHLPCTSDRLDVRLMGAEATLASFLPSDLADFPEDGLEAIVHTGAGDIHFRCIPGGAYGRDITRLGVDVRISHCDPEASSLHSDGYQLVEGNVLRGEICTYAVLKPLGLREESETYEARVSTVRPGAEEFEVGQRVVIRIPRLDPSTPLYDNVARVASFSKTLLASYPGFLRLRLVDCVARVLDHGTYQIALGPARSAPASFLVYDFIEGRPLDVVMRDEFAGDQSDSFTGIPTASEFFDWASRLAKTVVEMHRRQVIHGDIRPTNILVSRVGAPVLIALGHALFRDALAVQSGTNPYLAPEGSGSLGADVYSLGGVLYYLATGDVPPEAKADAAITDIDALKERLADDIRQRNPSLYKENCGIVDIVARCLRYSQVDRTPHIESVRQDIATFSTITPARFHTNTPKYVDEIKEAVQDLDLHSNSLLPWMLSFKLRNLVFDIEDLKHGIYNLTGTHEDIVAGFTQYVSFLGPGDEYLTVSIPRFWHRRNLGSNGRFLSMSKLAVQHGATIRRIFLISREDKMGDPELPRILGAHLRVVEELSEHRHEGDPSRKGSGYYVGVQRLAQPERDRSMKTNFGVLIKEGLEIVVLPVYSDEGVIVKVQFLSNSDLAKNLRNVFGAMDATAEPLRCYWKREYQR